MSPPKTSPSPYNVHIEPSGPLGGYVTVPPSKNYTSRIVLAASLAEGVCTINRPAMNDDAQALVRCCLALGATIEEQGDSLRITGVAGHPKNPGVLNPDNAGAVLRLLLGTACLIEGEVRFETNHTESLGRRPNEDLLIALRMLGAEAAGTGPVGALPITIRGGRNRVRGGKVSVSGARSSQFLSSLLFLTPHLDGPSEIEVIGENDQSNPVLVSRPLIDQTLEALRNFGAQIDPSDDGFRYNIRGSQTLKAAQPEISVNGDWPSAAALMSAMAVAGGMASLKGLSEDAQGERRAQSALQQMGCRFGEAEDGGMIVHSRGQLKAIEFNGDLATDAVLALEAAACLADGKSRFTNVGNLKIKESDRIRVPLEQLSRLGVESQYGDDWIEITGRPDGFVGGIEVDCCGDHRIAQLLAIVGLRCEKGLTLRGAECVSKSYPNFFEDLQALGVKLHRIGA